jgi:hypothetical protein
MPFKTAVQIFPSEASREAPFYITATQAVGRRPRTLRWRHMTTTTMTNKITPRAVAIFKEMRALRYYSAPWLRLANELGLELKLKSGQIILRPDPKNSRRSVWAVEQEEIWREVERAVADQEAAK